MPKKTRAGKKSTEPLRWLAVVGEFEEIDGGILFQGGELEAGGQKLHQIGNFICNCTFGSGRVSADIAFEVPDLNTACALILYYHTATNGLVTAQLGGPALCAIRYWTGNDWKVVAFAGTSKQLRPGQFYHFTAEVLGSQVRLTIDGITVLSAQLPFMLPVGQAGIWATGPSSIVIKHFDVERIAPRCFVVMQYTAPYNELYSDVIYPVVRELGYDVQRADDTYGPGLVIADIERQIAEARIIIAEITPGNLNVFWEVGYAHALRKPTILIAERETKLPFDVAPFRVLFYDNSISGKNRVEQGLKQHLAAIEKTWGTPDSVF